MIFRRRLVPLAFSERIQKAFYSEIFNKCIIFFRAADLHNTKMCQNVQGEEVLVHSNNKQISNPLIDLVDSTEGREMYISFNR